MSWIYFANTTFSISSDQVSSWGRAPMWFSGVNQQNAHCHYISVIIDIYKASGKQIAYYREIIAHARTYVNHSTTGLLVMWIVIIARQLTLNRYCPCFWENVFWLYVYRLGLRHRRCLLYIQLLYWQQYSCTNYCGWLIWIQRPSVHEVQMLLGCYVSSILCYYANFPGSL